MSEVTVIGLGAMGSVIARTLLHNGYRVTVWNRTSAKAEALVQEGAILAPSVALAVKASHFSRFLQGDCNTWVNQRVRHPHGI
jgi:3-hydroxyisobutyrate dehydrogenase-like beta-hydroxyacid dehydrogenase